MSEQMCRHWWGLLNTAVFNGVLYPPQKFHLVKFFREHQRGKKVEAFGWMLPCTTCDGTVTIKLLNEFDYRQIFITTLVHEMVHQYQWQFERNAGHGPTFFNWKDVVQKQTGLLLSTKIDDEIDEEN